MSKVDAQRALRDARYARFAAQRAEEATTAKPTKGATRTTPNERLASPADLAVEPARSAGDDVSGGDDVAAGAPAADPPAADRLFVEPAGEPSFSSIGQQAEAEELCGHRSINGRSCTRSKGHEQKNHRYA